MAKIKKNRNKLRVQNQSPQMVNMQKQKAETTIADVEMSKTETEFEKNKEAILKQFKGEIELLETEKKVAEVAAAEAKRLYEELEEKRRGLIKQKEELQTSYDAVNGIRFIWCLTTAYCGMMHMTNS